MGEAGFEKVRKLFSDMQAFVAVRAACSALWHR